MRGTHQLPAQRDKSGHRDKLSKQGELTLCEYGGRDKLERGKKWESEEHALPVECRGRDMSGYRKKMRKRRALTLCQAQGRDKSGHRNKPSERGALTPCRVWREGQVRSSRESEQAKGTHFLSHAKGGATQDIERNRASERGTHFLLSTEGGTIRTPKQTERARGTYFLSSAEEGITQETKTNRASEGHSHTVKHRGRNKSGDRNKPSERGALTSCREQREK